MMTMRTVPLANGETISYDDGQRPEACRHLRLAPLVNRHDNHMVAQCADCGERFTLREAKFWMERASWPSSP